MTPSMSFMDIQRRNLRILRRNPSAEISGCFGDIGTLLPIMITMSILGCTSLSSTLVITGIDNIVTGMLFGIPLPVQPMKALAAVAISRRYYEGKTAAAGLFVAGCVLLLSITGTLKFVAKYIPVPVVKGIQVGAGLSLIITAGSSQLQPLSWIGPTWSNNLLWAMAAGLFLILTLRHFRVPVALIVFVAGIVLAFIETPRRDRATWYPWRPRWYIPSGRDFKHGILEAGLGQLPLTILNSIIAVTPLSADLLPEVPPPSETALGLSVAAMNLVGCWLGAMPVCHGSGGLAGQHRFGARSGASPIMLGCLKLLLGLTFGDSLVLLLLRFPTALLGIMVIAAGLALAMVGETLNQGARDLKSLNSPLENSERDKRWTVMLITVAGVLAFRNDGVGFLAGMLAWWSYAIPDSLWTSRGSSRLTGSTSNIVGSSEREPLLNHP